MIDASKGFVKDANKNRLREQDIHRIVDVFNRQLEIPRYSRMVPISEIASPANDPSLNIQREWRLGWAERAGMGFSLPERKNPRNAQLAQLIEFRRVG